MNDDNISNDNNIIILFYKYVEIYNVDIMIEKIKYLASKLLGRVLIASEGINGTLSGRKDDINEFIKELEKEDERYCGIDWKTSIISSSFKPFPDLFIKKVNEIIGVGKAKEILDKFIKFDSNSFSGISDDCVGQHLNPEEWHERLKYHIEKNDKDYLLIDVRNEIESNVGYFESAEPINSTWYSETFKTLDNIIEKYSILDEDNNKPIFMYCTGGIRCEKASAYLLAKGLKKERCFQLKGGIHRYLEQYPTGGIFKGKNFVFDSRILVQGKDDEIDENVVGKCINCSHPSDNLSGSIICTVCRAVVIVCKSCVDNNPHQGEYFCSKHQFLKNCYFTVLEVYSKAELQQQLQDLNLIHDTVLTKVKVDKRRRRTVKRQIEKIQKRLNELSNIDNDNSDNSNVQVVNKQIRTSYWSIKS